MRYLAPGASPVASSMCTHIDFQSVAPANQSDAKSGSLQLRIVGVPSRGSARHGRRKSPKQALRYFAEHAKVIQQAAK